jgi:hypothetical protein
MYVYNVGQANCILVTVDNADQSACEPGQPPIKSAIFFDTGIQRSMGGDFQTLPIRQHIQNVIEDNTGFITNVWFVLSHTDDDHVNLFSTIAGICQNAQKPINGVIVGTNHNYEDRNLEEYKGFNHCIMKGAQKIDEVEMDLEPMCGNINANFQDMGSLEFLLPLHAEILSEGQPALYSVGSDANAASLVAKLTYGGRSILFPGDAPGKLFHSICFSKKRDDTDKKYKDVAREDHISALSNTDIFICPHHGSMSNNSYRWRGELNHSGMISIISSNPQTGNDKIPEKSFINCLLEGGITLLSHIVAYWSQLTQGAKSLQTTAPLLVTCCAGGGSGGIGYHVRIDTDGAISIFDIYHNDEGGEDELHIQSGGRSGDRGGNSGNRGGYNGGNRGRGGENRKRR